MKGKWSCPEILPRSWCKAAQRPLVPQAAQVEWAVLAVQVGLQARLATRFITTIIERAIPGTQRERILWSKSRRNCDGGIWDEEIFLEIGVCLGMLCDDAVRAHRGCLLSGTVALCHAAKQARSRSELRW
jgi:hypothetical protein